VGFPAAGTSSGSSLQGMSDRLAAHGGTLTVRSQPGQGTTIGAVPPGTQKLPPIEGKA
jgi:signal transduction histidine kinase